MSSRIKKESKRIVAKDPGLLTTEELLAGQGSNRKTLAHLIAQHKQMRANERNLQATIVSIARDKIRWFLDNARIRISYDDVMTLVTLFVLFGDAMKKLILPSSFDEKFEILVNVSFILFVIELILNSWVKSDFTKGMFKVKGYMFSFFFWLDLLCVVSMLPDLKWASSVFGIGDIPGSSMSAKAGKAGKIGAKAGKVVRMARLVRLVKLYKVTSQRRREKKIVEDLKKLVEHGHVEQSNIDEYLERFSAQKQSRVGAELSDIITRRVIVAVLLMLCVVPLLSYSSSGHDEIQSTEFLQAININSVKRNITDCDYLIDSTNEFKEFMNQLTTQTEEKYQYLIGLEINPKRCNLEQLLEFKLEDIFNSLRKTEVRNIKSNSEIFNGIEYSVRAIFNRKSMIEEEAKSGIYLTLFVVFMLVSLSTQFTGDAQKLVLAPIESMMEMVNLVADDPLEDYDFNSMPKSGEYETRVVQVAIQKITALLRVGFGVAGAEIISTNMSVKGEGSSVLEPMIPGKRVYAIFGFCDIHSFDLCTEKLEDEIMTFVNNVAKIVHEEVTRWGGLCNKNLGNAFLMVWRIGDESALEDKSARRRRKSSLKRSGLLDAFGAVGRSASTVNLRRIPGLDIVADKALIGFLRVIVELNRDQQILSYRKDNRLMLGDNDFLLRMGFGLHAGWAIEGAVGSLQKVDATYLSPHVNMAARMEAAAKQFGVAVLMTEKFWELMSNEAQDHCRKIDVVTVKGSAYPIPIYTHDTFQDQEFPHLEAPKFTDLDVGYILEMQAEDYDVSMWTNDKDLVQLRRLSTTSFRQTFKKGLEYYISGDWYKARDCLQEANKIMSNGNVHGDGPSQTLLRFMEAREWKCPSDWEGFRPLTSK